MRGRGAGHIVLIVVVVFRVRAVYVLVVDMAEEVGNVDGQVWDVVEHWRSSKGVESQGGGGGSGGEEL